MFLGNGQFLWICQDMPWWGLLWCWGVEVWGLKDSLLTFPHSVVCFLCCTNFFFWSLTAQLSSTMPSLAHDGSPRIAGPGVSAMYHHVCRWFATFCPLRSPVYCCIQCSELGYLGSIVSCQACCGWLQSSWWSLQHWYIWGTAWWMRAVAWCYHPAPVSTLHLRVASWLDPISAGIWMVAKASVVESIWTLDISIVSGSAPLLLCPSQLVILCEVMSAEQLRQHQPHHNGGLHQFQLHWPSSVFLHCCGV